MNMRINPAELYAQYGATVVKMGGQDFIVVKQAPTASDVHVNGVLTAISVAYIQRAENFISGRIFPSVPVQKQSDLYRTYPKGVWFRDEMVKRAPGTRVKMIEYDMSTTGYYCHVWGLGHPIPDQIRANADADIKLDANGSRLLTQLGMVRKETNWVNTFFKTGVWTTDWTGVSGAAGASQFVKWSDDNSNPIKDVKNAKLAMQQRTGGFEPNKLTLSQGVYNALTEHPDIVDRVKHMGSNDNPAKVNIRALTTLLELEEILVMKAVSNTAKEGQTDNMQFIAGDSALLTFTPSAATTEMPSAGYTFNWTGQVGSSDEGGRILRWYDQATRSDIIEIEQAWDQKLIAPDMGHFFSAAI